MPEDSSEYDRWHGALDATIGATDPWYELVKKDLRGYSLRAKRVLEIGCGRGGFVCWLASREERPAELFAMDLSPVAIEKGRELARRNGIEGITWRTGDIQAIDAANASFDAAISCETIEHVPDPPRAVRELARVLKPGGVLFLTCPNYMGTYGLYRAYLRLTGRRFSEVGQPINQLTMLPLVKRWVRQAGLSVTRVDAVGHYTFWPGRPPRRVPVLDRLPLTPFAFHSLVVARKTG